LKLSIELKENSQKKNKQLKSYTYHINRDELDGGGCFFTVEENEIEQNMREHMERWRCTPTLIVPLDLFNDRIDYTCNSFQDVIRLNQSLSTVIEKYSFLDPKRAQVELEKFKNNFEVLQTCLGDVEESLHIHTQPYSKLDYYQSELDEINARIENIYSNSDISLAPTWESTSTSHTLSNNGKTATLISGGQGCLLSKNGYSRGIKEWRLRMHSRTSTCMVGVAPATVSRTSHNYSTAGFFCNLDDGTLYSGPPFSYSNRAFITGGVRTGQTLIVTLNCTDHTLSYTVDGVSHGVAYTGLPDVQLFLAFDNNTTAGSSIEMLN
jgi:hypothetical protein